LLEIGWWTRPCISVNGTVTGWNARPAIIEELAMCLSAGALIKRRQRIDRSLDVASASRWLSGGELAGQRVGHVANYSERQRSAKQSQADGNHSPACVSGL
jgi:hypothetical protein